MYLTTDRHLAHAFAEQLLQELRYARSSAKALARYTGSIDAAKAETRLAFAIDDITDLSAQLAPASPEKEPAEPAESAETAALRTAAAAFANFCPPEA